MGGQTSTVPPDRPCITTIHPPLRLRHHVQGGYTLIVVGGSHRAARENCGPYTHEPSKFADLCRAASNGNFADTLCHVPAHVVALVLPGFDDRFEMPDDQNGSAVSTLGAFPAIVSANSTGRSEPT